MKPNIKLFYFIFLKNSFKKRQMEGGSDPTKKCPELPQEWDPTQEWKLEQGNWEWRKEAGAQN